MSHVKEFLRINREYQYSRDLCTRFVNYCYLLVDDVIEVSLRRRGFIIAIIIVLSWQLKVQPQKLAKQLQRHEASNIHPYCLIAFARNFSMYMRLSSDDLIINIFER